MQILKNLVFLIFTREITAVNLEGKGCNGLAQCNGCGGLAQIQDSHGLAKVPDSLNLAQTQVEWGPSTTSEAGLAQIQD